jgi:hypothetical protein
MIEPGFTLPYFALIAISLGVVWLSIKRHRLTRLLFILIFLLAGLINIFIAFTRPEVYQYYGGMAIVDFYRDFIYGYFKQHTIEIVSVIGLGQIAIAALLSTSGLLLKLGSTGGVIFFIAMAPLGFGSAFPATLILALALVFMQYRLD